GVGRMVLSTGIPASPISVVRRMDSVGGWAKVKFRAPAKLEFSAAAGQDNPYARDLRDYYQTARDYPASVGRNRAWLANFIYRPRSDLLFSTEYRHIRTFFIDDPDLRTKQISVSMGVLF